MDQIEKICGILEKKAELFEEYEEASLQLLYNEADEWEHWMTRRQSLIEQIDFLDAQMAQLWEEMGEFSVPAQNAASLKCRRSQLPECIWPIFDKAQCVFAAANRVREKEPLIARRIEDEMSVLAQKIKDHNKSAGAQAARYSAGADTGTAAYGGSSRKV